MCKQGNTIVLLLVFVGLCQLTLAQQQPLELTEQLGGNCEAVFVQGNYAYLSEGIGFRIVDVTNPAAPLPLGKVEFPYVEYVPMSIYVSGNYAYVATGETGLIIIDVSDPNAPQMVSSIKEPGPYGFTSDVYGQGHYIYIANGIWGFAIYDVSDPRNPQWISDFARVYRTYYSVCVVGNYLYLGLAGTFEVWDITNPVSPLERARLSGVGRCEDVAVSGNYAYLAIVDQGLKVVEVSNPDAPQVVGQFPTAEYVYGVAVQGNYAYLAEGFNGLRIVDISNPAAPAELGHYITEKYAKGIYAAGDLVYVACAWNGLKVFDVTNPASPAPIGAYNIRGESQAVYVAGSYAYVTNKDNGMVIYDVSMPENPKELGYCYFYGYADAVQVAGDYAYVADGEEGLLVIDVSNPLLPQVVTTFSPVDSVYDVCVVGDSAYLATSEGLMIVDVSNPLAPVEVGSLTIWSCKKVAVQGQRAYMLQYGSVTIVDVSNPVTPTEIGFYDPDYETEDIAVEGNYVYVALGSIYEGLHVLDVSDPANPRLVSTHPYHLHDVYLRDQVLFCGTHDGVKVYDVSWPQLPAAVGDYFVGSESCDVFFAGDYLYLTAGKRGLYILRYHGSWDGEFEGTDEGWQFLTPLPGPGDLSHWVAASPISDDPHALGIETSVDESTNYFALWDSLNAPHTAIPGGIYWSRWSFSTTNADPNTLPSVRFRMGLLNQKAFSICRLYPGGWLPLAQRPESTEFSAFLFPPISSEGLYLAFSLIDWTDDFRAPTWGSVYLEEVQVRAVVLEVFRETTPVKYLRGADFDVWFSEGAPGYEQPHFIRETDHSLSLHSGIGASLVYGNWRSPNSLFSLEPDAVYRLRCTVNAMGEIPGVAPAVCGLRVHSDDFRCAWRLLLVGAGCSGAIPCEGSREYELYLRTPSTGALPVFFAFELIDFSPFEGGTINLEDIEIDRLP